MGKSNFIFYKNVFFFQNENTHLGIFSFLLRHIFNIRWDNSLIMLVGKSPRVTSTPAVYHFKFITSAFSKYLSGSELNRSLKPFPGYMYLQRLCQTWLFFKSDDPKKLWPRWVVSLNVSTSLSVGVAIF